MHLHGSPLPHFRVLDLSNRTFSPIISVSKNVESFLIAKLTCPTEASIPTLLPPLRGPSLVDFVWALAFSASPLPHLSSVATACLHPPGHCSCLSSLRTTTDSVVGLVSRHWPCDHPNPFSALKLVRSRKCKSHHVFPVPEIFQ